MDVVAKHYSLIDFFYYILPGGAALSAFLVLSPGLLDYELFPQWLEAILFVLASYLVGHLLQTAGKPLERVIYPTGYPSAAMLSESNTAFSQELKSRIIEAVRKEFGFVPKKEQETFSLCYSYIIAHAPRNKALPFLALFGFYRGVTTSLLIIAALLWVKAMILPTVLVGLLSILAALRFRYYGVQFARNVYLDFIVVIDKKN